MAEKKAKKSETKKPEAKKSTAKKPAAKKSAPKKSTPKKVQWHDGYPTEVGLFHCKQGKKETVLRHLYCEMTCKHKWATVAGQIPCGDAIEWTSKPLGLEEIQKIIG